jgi:hypothetical protein
MFIMIPTHCVVILLMNIKVLMRSFRDSYDRHRLMPLLLAMIIRKYGYLGLFQHFEVLHHLQERILLQWNILTCILKLQEMEELCNFKTYQSLD